MTSSHRLRRIYLGHPDTPNMTILGNGVDKCHICWHSSFQRTARLLEGSRK